MTNAVKIADSETRGEVAMPQTVRRRIGPQYHPPTVPDEFVSAALREARDSSHGLGSRFPYPHLQAVRAGRLRSPHLAAAEWVWCCRQAGLPRASAERLAGFVAGVIERVYGSRPEPLAYTAEREAKAEATANVLATQWSFRRADAPTLRALIDAEKREYAETPAHIAALEAELARLEGRAK